MIIVIPVSDFRLSGAEPSQRNSAFDFISEMEGFTGIFGEAKWQEHDKCVVVRTEKPSDWDGLSKIMEKWIDKTDESFDV